MMGVKLNLNSLSKDCTNGICDVFNNFRLSDFAIVFFIFSTVFFNEGALVSVISKVFIFVIFFLEIFKTKRFIVCGFLTAAFVFLLLCAASVTWTLTPASSVARFQTMLYQFVCYACLITLLWRDTKATNISLLAFVLSTIISGLWVVVFNGVSFQENRYSEGFVASGQLAITSAISMAICLYEYRKSKRMIHLVTLIPLALFLVFTSGRRGLLFIVVFAILFTILCSNDARKTFFYILGSLISVSVVYLLLVNVSFFYEYVGMRLESFVWFIFFGGDGDASTTGRNRLINFGIQLFWQSPWIGNGVDSFSALFLQTHGSWDTSADNNYVELLADLGVIGFLCYYVPLVIFLVHTAKQHSTGMLDIRFSLCAVIAMATIDFASVWFYSKCGMLAIVLFYVVAKNADSLETEMSRNMARGVSTNTGQPNLPR